MKLIFWDENYSNLIYLFILSLKITKSLPRNPFIKGFPIVATIFLLFYFLGIFYEKIVTLWVHIVVHY
jgi:hypothetical protein